MSEILDKYNLIFTYDKGNTTVSSIYPLLSYYLNNSALSQATALYNALKHSVQYYKSKERDVMFAKVFTIKLAGDNARIIYNDPENPLKFPETSFTLPIDDLLAILQSWSAFLFPYKVRDVTVKNGEGIIDIISDHFASALFIEKPVAVVWPDCAGSIGEYYAVSRESYDRQKELTANLTQFLTVGSDQEVFDAVTVFLNVFANGKYRVTISAADVASAEFAYDVKMTYADGANEDNTITYGFYAYGYGEVLLFSRSIDTIDQNRVEEYKEIIKNGGRPKIILFYGSIEEYSYVLDGHHKLLAYQELSINAPAVIINKVESAEKPQKSLLPEVLDILKPVEAMHMIKNGDLTNPEVYTSKVITSYLDKILTSEKNIGTTITRMLYSAYHSADKNLKDWTNERLSVLRRNKYKGNGQTLYYTDSEKKYHFKNLFIESDNDFFLWKKIYLEDGGVPANLEERQKEISERYCKPYLPVKKNNDTLPLYIEGPRTYPVTPTSAIIVKILLISFLLICLIRACK